MRLPGARRDVSAPAARLTLEDNPRIGVGWTHEHSLGRRATHESRSGNFRVRRSAARRQGEDHDEREYESGHRPPSLLPRTSPDFVSSIHPFGPAACRHPRTRSVKALSRINRLAPASERSSSPQLARHRQKQSTATGYGLGYGETNNVKWEASSPPRLGRPADRRSALRAAASPERRRLASPRWPPAVEQQD